MRGMGIDESPQPRRPRLARSLVTGVSGPLAGLFPCSEYEHTARTLRVRSVCDEPIYRP